MLATEGGIVELEETQVVPQVNTKLEEGYFSALDTIKNIPGGGSVFALDQDYIGRVATTADLFRFDPGVYAQSGSVPLDARLSIRGSGATRRFGNRGLTLLIDGVPANHVDGSFYTRAYDFFATEYVAVLRGANGLPYGGNQVGGVINFVQKNGITAAGTQAVVEYGSYESVSTHLGHGYHAGNHDFYISGSWTESDGFRDGQDYLQYHLTGNYGYAWSNTVATRWYLLYSDSDAELASGLSKRQALNEPQSSVNSGNEDRDLATFRLSQNTDFELGDTHLSIFNYLQILDFDHLTRSAFPANQIDYDTDELGIGLRTVTDYELGGWGHRLRSHVLYNWGENEIGGFRSVFGGGPPQQLANDRVETSANFQIYVENNTAVHERIALIYGIGWQYAHRERDNGPRQQTFFTSPVNDYEVSYDGCTPRLGVVFDVDQTMSLFGNYSHSYEAPALSEADALLDAQQARTLEVGTRFDKQLAQGELVYYYSQIKDDFIDFDTGGGSFSSQNHDTQRQGIEASLTLSFFDFLDTPASIGLYWDNTYQWNDFTFDGGMLDGKKIPGISENVFISRIRLADASRRWRIALTMERVASGLELNNDNSLDASDPFTLVHVSGEWVLRDGLTIYGGVDNIFDEAYINTVTINPFGNSTTAAYSPGSGIRAYLGLQVHFK